MAQRQVKRIPTIDRRADEAARALGEASSLGQEAARVMARRKGEMTPRRVDREFPHQVEIAIPEGGLGNKIHEMDAFCRERGFRFAKRGIGKLRRVHGSDATRYYFVDAAAADEFAMRFGGERVSPITKGPVGPTRICF